MVTEAIWNRVFPVVLTVLAAGKSNLEFGKPRKIVLFVEELSDKAIAVAKQIGKVTVDMGDTACKVPSAVEYIEKVTKRRGVGKKRTTARC